MSEDDPDFEEIELLSDADLALMACDLSEALMATVTGFAGARDLTTIDSRVVAAACGLVAGSYVVGIPDIELRRAFVDHWIENLRLASGTQPQ